jgi:hypothetical protein
MVITAAAMARGMSRRGLSVSSPKEAAPSKPPNERSPKTAAKATVPMPTPLGSVKGESVKPWPFGAVPAMTLAKMTTTTITMSVTVSPSMVSKARVATLTSPYATNQMSAAATSEITSHSALGHMPVLSKNACPKSPTSAEDAAVKER